MPGDTEQMVVIRVTNYSQPKERTIEIKIMGTNFFIEFLLISWHRKVKIRDFKIIL